MANEIVSLDIPQEELARYHGVVTAVAPWAKQLNVQETGLVLRKVLAMGLNPLDGREVHIWKDKRGNVNVQPHYSLVVEWVEKTKPRHTEPIFERLTAEALREEGLPGDAIAYRCRFMLIEDVDRMTAMIASGAFDNPKEIRAMFEICGLGVALAAEYNGQYFSPAGRSPSWKVKKRALVDAYTRKWGNPNPEDVRYIRSLRPAMPEAELIEDVQVRNPALTYDDAVKVARHEQHREEREPLSDQDKSDAKSALFGDFESAPDAVFTESPLGDGPTPEDNWMGDADADDDAGEEAVAELTAEAFGDAALKIRNALRARAGWTPNMATREWERAGGDVVGNGQAGKRIAAVIGKAMADVAGVDPEAPHHAILNYLFGVASTKALTEAEAEAICSRWDAGSGWTPDPESAAEVRLLWQAIQQASGQLPLV